MHHSSEKVIAAAATRVWSVTEFCRRHGLGEKEELKLTRLFGQFATACELRYNVTRPQRRN